MSLSRRSLLARGAAALVAVSGLEKLIPAAPAKAAPLIGDAIVRIRPNPAPFAAGLSGSGGLCTPILPYYDLELLNARRPVRDSLVTFNAERGGIVYGRPS